MKIQRISYTNGKELLLIAGIEGIKGWQRMPEGVDWEKMDVKILDKVPVPPSALIDQKIIY